MRNDRIKNKIYVNALIVLVIFAIGYFFIYPQYKGSGMIYNPSKNISSLLKEKKDYDNTLSLATQYLDRINKTNSTYSNVLASEVPVEKINKILPKTADPIVIIYELMKIASRPETNMKLSSPQFSDDSKNNNSNNFNTLSINFSTEGTYEQLKAFLKNLESSERIYNVTSLSFSSSRSTKSSSVLNYSLNVETYYLK